MTADRDPIVARALREMPVPDHRPGFWEALDRRLDAETADASGTEGAAGAEGDDRTGVGGLAPVTTDDSAGGRVDTRELPVVTELRPPRPAPARHRARFLVAAAVVAVAALAAGLFVRGGDEDGGELAGQPTSSSTAPSTTIGTPSTLDTFDVPPPSVEDDPETTTTLDARPFPATPSAAVEAFTVALGEGDLERARALLGPATERYLTATGTDPDRILTTMAEGFGAWSASPDRSVREVVIPSVGAVVVLEGTIAPEGRVEQRADAFPTVRTEGGWLVEPLAFASPGGRIEVHSPRTTPDGSWALDADEAFQVAARGARRFWFSLDGGSPVPDDDGSYDPPGELPRGTRLLVVAAVGDNVFTAEAGRIEVDG
jgi:hypothetical protein